MQHESVPLASVIIPQFHRADLTIGCLRSLCRNERAAFEAIVVDDGSPDAADAVSALRLPHTRVVAQSHRGVSAAWNRGAWESASPYLVFLNNDALVRGPFIERLVSGLQRAEALVSGVSMRRETALPQEVLARLPTERFLQGWCFAISNSDFRRLGGFDESMAVYWSDTDLQCRQLTRFGADDSGLAALSDLPLSHLGHRTTRQLSERRRQWRADRNAFIRKWRMPGQCGRRPEKVDKQGERINERPQ